MRRGIVIGGILAAVVITALWWLLIIQPRNAEVDDVNREIEDAAAQEDQLQSQILALSAIKVQETSYLFAIGQMESAIPLTPEADAFIEQINFLAQRTGVELLSLTLAPPTQSTTEGQTGFEIQTAIAIEGEYFEVLGFLYGLEELERIVRVDTLTINPLAVSTSDETEEPEEGEEDTDPTDDPRPRPNPTVAQVNLGATLFTRTGVVLPEEEEDTDSTTTTTSPGETTTTTAPGETTTTTGGEE
jgi:Tfp pilus assembly protein PilO